MQKGQLASSPAPKAEAQVTDAADAGAAHGTVGIDHVWRRRLQRAIDETVPPVSFEDAVRPLTQHFPEINFDDLRAVAQGQREVWHVCVCTHTHTHMYRPTYIRHTHTHTHTCIHKHTHDTHATHTRTVHTHTHARAHTHT